MRINSIGNGVNDAEQQHGSIAMSSERRRIDGERTWRRAVATAVLVMLLAAAWPGGAAWGQAEDAEEGGDDAAADQQQAEPEQEQGEAPIQVDEEAGELVQGGRPLEIVIEAVQGMVQVRADEEAEFERAEEGMELAVGATLRTGPRSVVRFRVGPTQVITLDRFGTVQVLEAIEQEGVVTTDVGMPYGRTTYEVQDVEDVEHSGQIRSPSATLAVRGSRGFLEDYADRPPTAGSDYGDIAFVNSEGRFVELDPPSRIEGDQTAGGQKQVADGTFNRFGLSLSELEFLLLGMYPSGTFEQQLAGFEAFYGHDGAAASFGYFGDRFEGPGDGGGGELGPLTFDVRWEAPLESGDFVVNNNLDEIMRPSGPTSTEGGGWMEVTETSGITLVSAGWDEPVFTTYHASLQNLNEVNLFVSFLLGELMEDGSTIVEEERFEFVLEPGEIESISITVPD